MQLAEDRLLREQQVLGWTLHSVVEWGKIYRLAEWNCKWMEGKCGFMWISVTKEELDSLIYSTFFNFFLMVFFRGHQEIGTSTILQYHLLAFAESTGCSPPLSYQQWIYRISLCIPWPSVSLHTRVLFQCWKGPRIWGGIACRSTRSYSSSWGGSPFCKIYLRYSLCSWSNAQVNAEASSVFL